MRRRSGFTLVELLAAMTIGLLILGAASSFAINTWRTQSRGQAGEDTTRRARYLGTSLQRDIGEVGVLVNSRPAFGTVQLFNDTLAMIRVPTRDTVVSPTYLVRNLSPTPPLGEGTCGTDCLDIGKRGGRVEIQTGEVFLLNVPGNVNRLLLATNVTDPSPSDTNATVRIRFLNTLDSLFHWPARLTGVQLTSGASVQRLALAAYFRDRSTDTTILMRATEINTSGQFVPTILTTGVLGFEAQVQFANGTFADNAFPADAARDFCAISNVLISATLTTDRPADPRIAASAAVTRPFAWNYVARNLVFQRNARRNRPCV
ncbi:MAG: prepilin-type N-terminal cleavage/methylation domain-containing protein [Gemmatimonadaceae bacterium]|jgi:prepilin-type N-terminal cleavage/methylation domain-containing protein|nr:prepilin-type N-terminal cleavage/methylation domain-containing protein [Gemmatimonadaceae bacterium]